MKKVSSKGSLHKSETKSVRIRSGETRTFDRDRARERSGNVKMKKPGSRNAKDTPEATPDVITTPEPAYTVPSTIKK